MYTGKIVFAQVMEYLPLRRLRTCVDRYQGDFKVKTFTCQDHFRVMAFAQLSQRESLRDIEVCLRAMASKLYHMGIRSSVSRNNLSHANEVRDWRIYADFAQLLIAHARRLYADEHLGAELDELTLYALDASTIDLCLSVFPWARFRRTKAAVKLHTLLDLRGNIPTFIHISEGRLHDVNALDLLLLEAGAFYVMDRGYLDFERLYRINRALAFFVIRSKRGIRFRRQRSRPVDKSTGLRCDQTVLIGNRQSALNYPGPLRRIVFVDPVTDKRLTLITNNFDLSALTIAQLYKARWQVELFFKWIKQNLKIKAFLGTSKNAVMTQIWVAMCVYLMLAYIKFLSKSALSMQQMIRLLHLNLFDRRSLQELLDPGPPDEKPPGPQQSLMLA